MKSADGDTVSGAVHFTLTAAAAPSSPTLSSTTASAPPSSASPPSTSSATGRGGLPAWVWIVVGVVLVIAGGFFALRLRRWRQLTSLFRSR